MDDFKDILTALVLLLSWFVISRSLGAWITDNYYLIETITLLLIFGLLHELYTSAGSGGLNFLEELIAIGEEFGRTGAQLGLLIGVSSLVLSSIVLRDWVQARFGPLAVVQLLAFVAIISRAFVNVRATGNPWQILDGTRATYLVYTVGALAIVLSFLLREAYHPSTTMHNALVIFSSTVLPTAYFYLYTDEEALPSLEEALRL